MSEQETLPARPPGRPRSETADRAIIDATLDLMADVGMTALTIEQVACAAGVGKATVYRRWANKDALLVDALATLNDDLPDVADLPVRDALVEIVDFVRRGSDTRAGRLLPCLVAEGRHHPDVLERYRHVVAQPRRQHLRTILENAVARGELPRTTDVGLVMLMLVGPVLHLRSMAVTDEITPVSNRKLSERIVDTVLAGLSPG
jgi:AcrR family transcriptional regulator